MKLSKIAAVVAQLCLATDAKPTEAQILAACIAADKKGKDEGGLGPVEIQNKKAKDKAKDGKDDPEKTNDEFPEKDDKAEDEKDDDKAKDEKDDDKAEDEDDMDAEDDVQPKESVTGGGAPAGNAGPKPAKDKKGMDAATLVRKAIAAERALNSARTAVEPVLGVVTYDSAAEVYAAALKKLGVATDGIDASAYPEMFRLARKAADAGTPVIASDAATVKTMAGAIKGYDRLR